MYFFGQRRFFLFALIFSCGILTACMVGPDFKRPEPPKVQAYTETPLPSKTASASGTRPAGKAQYFANGKDIPAQWWFLFHSQTLNDLIAQGLANSPNLAAAKAALVQAKENVNAQVGSTLYPALSGQFNATREAFSDEQFGAPGSRVFNLFNPILNISYTLDVFGGARRGIEALCAQVNYQNFELEAAYLTLSSNIVTTAINAASFKAQIEATRELIAAQEKTLTLVQDQFRLGGASEADVLAQQTQLAQSRASLPPLEQSYAQAQHLLSILVGAFPSERYLASLDLDHLELPVELPLTLPSSVAEQRPDIRASEALMHAATAQVGVATANLYPQITLNGSYGWENNSFNSLISHQFSIWSLGTQITQPIFNGGSLLAKRRAAMANLEQVKAQYKQTILQAFQNVADTLRAIENDAKAFKAQSQAEAAARATLKLTQQQYRLGGVSYLSLLNAQRQYQQSKLGRIQAQAARYNDTVALFQALGGGWWNRGSNGPATTDK